MAIVNITINGRNISVPAGITVLQAARQEGIDIPTLCDHPALSAVGACRMCIVEIKGQRNLQTACTFPVTDGMEIETESAEVVKARTMVLKMLFSERNHFCPFCEMSGSCELQDMGYRFGVDHWAFSTYTKNYAVDATHKHYLMDHNRCILCGRCIRACGELVANHTLGLGQRGSESMINADANLPLNESTCISCGTCVQVCPTGALFYKRSAYMGSDSEMIKVKSTCSQCSIGCGIEIITRGGNVLQIMGDWEGQANRGVLCKAGRFDPLYDGRERIPEPLHRSKDGEENISWAKAMQALAKHITKVGPDKIGVIVANRASNEALYLIKKLFIDELGVSNIKMIHAPAPRIEGKPHGTLSRIAGSDTLLVVGSDPLANQPVAAFQIKRALDKGARLIVVDDENNALSPFAHVNLKISDIGQAVEMASKSPSPVIVYGPGIPAPAVDMLKGITDRANFIAIETGVNTCTARALDVNKGFKSEAVELLLVLLGDGKCGGVELLKDIGGNTFIAVLAGYASELTDKANLVMPNAIWCERTGTLTNTEGRIQTLQSAVEPANGAKSDWEVLQMLAAKLGKKITVSADDVANTLATAV